MAAKSNPAKDIEARRKFAAAFNDTLLRIWEERIIALGVVDTYKLLRSLNALQPSIDRDALEVKFNQEFETYGIFQDSGTGRDTPVGNPGDIGRPKVRKRRPWFNPKFYMSYRNLLEMFAESVGKQAMNIITNALSDKNIRNSLLKK